MMPRQPVSDQKGTIILGGLITLWMIGFWFILSVGANCGSPFCL